MITPFDTQIIIKKILFFHPVHAWIWRQKYQKSNFCKNKKVINIDDIHVNKILVSKEESDVLKINLNTLLNTMMMMLSDHYA